MPGTEFGQEFCDAWNFAVGKGSRIDGEKFSAAVDAKPFQDNEKVALRFLQATLREDDAQALTASVLTVAKLQTEGMITLSERNALLRVLSARSRDVPGVKISFPQPNEVK